MNLLKNTGIFLKYFWITILAATAPVAVFLGFVAADNNTRKLAYNDTQPAFNVSTGDGEPSGEPEGLTVTAFGLEFNISDGALEQASDMAKTAAVALPPGTRIIVNAAGIILSLFK